jgi:hypothetical protein
MLWPRRQGGLVRDFPACLGALAESRASGTGWGRGLRPGAAPDSYRYWYLTPVCSVVVLLSRELAVEITSGLATIHPGTAGTQICGEGVLGPSGLLPGNPQP